MIGFDSSVSFILPTAFILPSYTCEELCTHVLMSLSTLRETEYFWRKLYIYKSALISRLFFSLNLMSYKDFISILLF